MDPGIIWKYFPDLDDPQKEAIGQLGPLYTAWNQKVNLISRKDIEALYTRHVLHSLAIAKFIRFNAGAHVLDVGTGGGFPGIPLAIFFPETEFLLVDSIRKKIDVINDVIDRLEITNVKTKATRAENITESVDFIISRAVARTDKLIQWVGDKLLETHRHDLDNGLILLKGGDLSDELDSIHKKSYQITLTDYFQEPFFETKKIIYIPK